MALWLNFTFKDGFKNIIVDDTFEHNCIKSAVLVFARESSITTQLSFEKKNLKKGKQMVMVATQTEKTLKGCCS